jgi:sRNA-binding protein
MFGQDHNKVIDCLSELYPRCFFRDPKKRLPLKVNITADIEKAADPSLAQFNVGAAVAWYTGHVGYDYCCATAGNERVDLNGKVVGKVTENEARDAQARIAVKSKDIAARRNPVRIVKTLHGIGGMTDDQFRKIPAPPAHPPALKSSVEQIIDEAIVSLTKARELLALDNTALRVALLKAALSVAEGSIKKIVETVK